MYVPRRTGESERDDARNRLHEPVVSNNVIGWIGGFYERMTRSKFSAKTKWEK